MQKNVAGQKWLVFCFNMTDNTPTTGDAANITAKIRKDYGSLDATNDANPTELEDGYYEFDMTQAESNADVLQLFPESSTGNMQVIGVPGEHVPIVLQTGDSFALANGATGFAAILDDTANTLPAQISGLSNVSSGDVSNACNTSLTSYDGPTNTEMNARTLVAANYALNSVATETRLARLDATISSRSTFDYTSQKVTPIDADGVTFESIAELILAGVAGQTAVNTSAGSVTLYKQDGTTSKVVRTYSGVTNTDDAPRAVSNTVIS